MVPGSPEQGVQGRLYRACVSFTNALSSRNRLDARHCFCFRGLFRLLPRPAKRGYRPKTGYLGMAGDLSSICIERERRRPARNFRRTRVKTGIPVRWAGERIKKVRLRRKCARDDILAASRLRVFSTKTRPANNGARIGRYELRLIRVTFAIIRSRNASLSVSSDCSALRADFRGVLGYHTCFDLWTRQVGKASKVGSKSHAAARPLPTHAQTGRQLAFLCGRPLFRFLAAFHLRRDWNCAGSAYVTLPSGFKAFWGPGAAGGAQRTRSNSPAAVLEHC